MGASSTRSWRPSARSRRRSRNWTRPSCGSPLRANCDRWPGGPRDYATSPTMQALPLWTLPRSCVTPIASAGLASPSGEVPYRTSGPGSHVAPLIMLRRLAVHQSARRLGGHGRIAAAHPPVTPRLDARQVLYGRVADFIVAQCLAARTPLAAGSPWTPPQGWSLQRCRNVPRRANPCRRAMPWPESMPVADDRRATILVAVPARRVAGEERPSRVGLQDRCLHWSLLGQCPPALGEESAAFRWGEVSAPQERLVLRAARDTWFASVGSVSSSRMPTPGTVPIFAPRTQSVGGRKWDCLLVGPTESPADVARWLRHVQDEWLGAPNWEDLSGRTPAEVIHCERRRIPMAMSGREAMVDDDCPLCQMLADSPGPMFWHLDGCNQDDDFPSLHCRTRQEWEEEQRRHEEFNRKFEEECRCQRAVMDSALPGSEPGSGPRRSGRGASPARTRARKARRSGSWHRLPPRRVGKRLERPAGHGGVCGIARSLVRQSARRWRVRPHRSSNPSSTVSVRNWPRRQNPSRPGIEVRRPRTSIRDFSATVSGDGE